jgi:tartronate-semialdehyde synthase
MSKMRTVDAAVAILEKEGAIEAFGLPGAAINPFYSAMRAHGGIRHTLARHVEGASHMADGYSRAQLMATSASASAPPALPART